MQHVQEKPATPSLASVGLRLSDWFERWFPDAFSLALAAIAIVFVAAAYVRGDPVRTAPASLPDSLKRISGVIPLDQTLGLWQSLLLAVILIIVSVAIAYYSAPDDRHARGIDAMGVQLPPEEKRRDRAETPGEWLEYSP